jgi:aryl-alcohol dehydrogenase-like predicted oxidoreductase
LTRLTASGRERRARPVVGSKWGYTYTAGWQTDAEVHEVKEHSRENFRRQIVQTRAELGDDLDLYQIHSATLQTGVLADDALLDDLAALKEAGTAIGLSVSGADQRAVIDAALGVHRDGMLLFDTVQATWNLLEPSSGAALARAHDAGLGVIVKEGVANGRLTPRGELADPGTPLGAVALVHDAGVDAIALAAVLAQDFTDVVLSGAATVAHLHANLEATRLVLTPAELEALDGLAEEPGEYWGARGDLPWQ